MALDGDRVVIEDSAGRKTFSQDELPRVTFDQPRRRDRRFLSVGVTAGKVWLADGAVLPITAAQTPGDILQLALHRDSIIEPASIAVSLDHVRAVKFPPAHRSWGAALESQWTRLRHQSSAGDLLALPRREGQSLDYVEGFIESIDDQTVTILFDDEPVEVNRKRVYGIVFADTGDAARGGQEEELLTGPRVTAQGGVAINSSRVVYMPNELLEVRSTSDINFLIPIERVKAIDYRVGRLVYLSDLKPISQQVVPLFGTPRGLADLAYSLAVRADGDRWGQPLSVNDPTAQTGMQTFEKGLSLRAGGEAVYELASKYRRLCATVAIDPAAAGARRLRLLIEAEGRMLIDQELTEATPPIDLNIELRNASRLRMRVIRDGSLDASIHLGDARLIR